MWSLCETSFAKWKTRSDVCEVCVKPVLLNGKLGVMRVATSQWGFTRPSSIFFSLGVVRDIVPPVIKKKQRDLVVIFEINCTSFLTFSINFRIHAVQRKVNLTVVSVKAWRTRAWPRGQEHQSANVTSFGLEKRALVMWMNASLARKKTELDARAKMEADARICHKAATTH